MPYELFIGLRYLKAKRKTAFISIITLISTAGVTLGVMALIIVLAVMTGFEEDLKEKILGTNAHIVVLKSSGGIGAYDQLMEKLKKVDGVVAGTLADLDVPAPSPVSGAEPPRPGLIIGKELAKNLSLYVGDTVNVISPLGNITPLGMI